MNLTANKKEEYLFYSLVIGITSICNLRCIYCQNDPFMKRMKLKIMKEEILSKLTEEAVKAAEFSRKKISFCFTGGEPLLAGVSYFEDIVNLQERYKKNAEIENIIQTNATLIDDDWISFFERKKIFVSISIDGTERIQNLQRPMASSGDSFSIVKRNINKLREKKIPFGVISVITETSSAAAEEIVPFLFSLNPKIITFLPCIDRGDIVSPESYLSFMKKSFDIWIDPLLNKESIPVKMFRDTFLHILGIPLSMDCDYFGRCPTHPHIAVDGTVSVCDQYAGEKNGYMGNIYNNTLTEIIRSKKMPSFSCQEECNECNFFYLCNGGCHYRRSKNNGKEPFCDMRKKMFLHIYKKTEMLSNALTSIVRDTSN